MVGALVVAAPDLLAVEPAADRPRALLGDLLALVGAGTAATYFVAGRRLRGTLELWSYVGLVYGSCFVVLLVLSALTSAPLMPQPTRELAIFAGLALGPMLLGHTGLNWALKRSPAYVVNLTLLGEPIGATVIAAFLPGIREVPGPMTLVGGVIVLIGILLTARR
jgi:drug/metabolite transporter (DMT)-like permease